MSSFEYNDLFCKCQSFGIYHMFTFDIKGSKKMTFEERNIAEIKLVKLMLMMYNTLLEEEKKLNKKILVFEENFSYFGETRVNDFGMKQEPFLYGDMFGFTVYRDSISNDEIINFLKKLMCFLEIDFCFHCADGYYETNDWTEANTKYFRGYCIDLLSNLHKPINEKVVKFLKDNSKSCGSDIFINYYEKERNINYYEDDFEIFNTVDGLIFFSKNYNLTKGKKL